MCANAKVSKTKVNLLANIAKTFKLTQELKTWKVKRQYFFVYKFVSAYLIAKREIFTLFI
ncbi:hypothetical protein FD21_GL001105 [Liquorilactobacillus vini DSM 20605]|uniref:Uncharacterized protein n=1 Tax=Liquorilactobacillus vini DSM 20605 TaxID=1133569 RepID=A0A0R2CCU7_9LACO|nr:hypothetical protein FD21_GL001105 [Liquorilactobacillus vini DSM 20605]